APRASPAPKAQRRRGAEGPPAPPRPSANASFVSAAIASPARPLNTNASDGDGIRSARRSDVQGRVDGPGHGGDVAHAVDLGQLALLFVVGQQRRRLTVIDGQAILEGLRIVVRPALL